MRYFLFFLLIGTLWSCDSGNDSQDTDNFDRSAMLVDWADHIIIPAYQNYYQSLQSLNQKTKAFVSNPTVNQLEAVRNQWKTTYLAWQWVGMFNIGMAEAISLQTYTNMYPTDAVEIVNNISAGVYDLELPSRRNQQGLPALDYLINGLAATDTEIVARYTDDAQGAAYGLYLTTVVDRLETLTADVVDDWNGGYREAFVSNDGSGATGSVNKVANDFLYYFERYLRSAKIGIPAGILTGTPNATYVEAYHARDFSKALYLEALQASRAFFNGQYFGSRTTGSGFASYLRYLQTIQSGQDLVNQINTQFDVIETDSKLLADSFANQIAVDNTRLLDIYDELQKNVLHFKIDMLQQLNITVDYVDADGD